jgi:hypothetical protein
MFFQEVPPDTSVYMIAGYVIFFAVTAIYVASLFIRTRNLSRDLETLKEAEEEQRARVVPPPVSSRAAAKPKAVRAKSARAKTGKPKQANRRTR